MRKMGYIFLMLITLTFFQMVFPIFAQGFFLSYPDMMAKLYTLGVLAIGYVFGYLYRRKP